MAKLEKAKALRLERRRYRWYNRQAWFRHWRWRQARIAYIGSGIDDTNESNNDINNTNKSNDDIDNNITVVDQKNRWKTLIIAPWQLHVTLHVVFE